MKILVVYYTVYGHVLTMAIHLALHGYADLDYQDRSAILYCRRVTGSS